MMDKASLRILARNKRNTFVLNNIIPIDTPSDFEQQLRTRPIVAGYVASGSEADPAPLLATARACGCTIALPRVIGRDSAMTFHIRDDAALEPGPFGLIQPQASAAQVAPTLILLPLLAFDRRGTRLGQGGGHYDRALAALPNACRVGVAWSCQEEPNLPRDPWDIPLDFILTEKEWIVTS